MPVEGEAVSSGDDLVTAGECWCGFALRRGDGVPADIDPESLGEPYR